MRRFCLLAVAILISVPADSRSQEVPADRLYAQGKATLHDLRWQIFGVRDLVADARSERDPTTREYYVRRARRTLEKAKENAAKLKALIDAENAKGEDADQPSKYTLIVLQQQYDAYAKWVADAEAEVAALEAEQTAEESDAAPSEDVPLDEPSMNDTSSQDTTLTPAPNNDTASNYPFPTSDDLQRQSMILMRVDAVLHEIYLAQAHARAAYYREGMGRKMKLAFNRHGGTGRHGWIWSWADSLWMHQYGYVSDARYAHYRVAAERFRAHVEHAQRISVAHLEYADKLVELLPVWRQDIHGQYELMEQIIDQYGQCGSAGEQGDEEWSARADAESKRLIELLHRPSPVRIEPFNP